MKITITVISGFVSRNLSKYLVEKGNIVNGQWLRDKNYILKKNEDALIHLAGKAHYTSSTSTADDILKSTEV